VEEGIFLDWVSKPQQPLKLAIPIGPRAPLHSISCLQCQSGMTDNLATLIIRRELMYHRSFKLTIIFLLLKPDMQSKRVSRWALACGNSYGCNICISVSASASWLYALRPMIYLAVRRAHFIGITKVVSPEKYIPHKPRTTHGANQTRK